MAKLAPIKLGIKAKTGEKFSFECDLSVTSEGFFQAVIPEELNPIVHDLIKGEFRKNAEVVLKGRYGNTKPVISSNTMDTCKTILFKALEIYAYSEIEEELVIIFRTQHDITYYKVGDKIFPNGRCNPNYEQDYRGGVGSWQGNLNSSNRRELYSIGFAATCRKKVTYKRTTGTRTEFIRENGIKSEFWCKLDDFCGLTFPTEQREIEKYYTVIPYTEETAKFFYETMLAMCNLADRLTAFFGNTDNVFRAIEANQQLLLTSGNYIDKKEAARSE
jgi:hypothetical protein